MWDGGGSLGDYITCGRYDVISGRHTGGWSLTKNLRPFLCLMFARQCQYCFKHKAYDYNDVCLYLLST